MAIMLNNQMVTTTWIYGYNVGYNLYGSKIVSPEMNCSTLNKMSLLCITQVPYRRAVALKRQLYLDVTHASPTYWIVLPV
jgi:hypothetical protein